MINIYPTSLEKSTIIKHFPNPIMVQYCLKTKLEPVKDFSVYINLLFRCNFEPHFIAHITVIDSKGNAVSLTSSINNWY